MDSTRRVFLAGAGAGLAATVAGCSAELTSDGVAVAATEKPLAPAVQRDTGYTHHRTREAVVTREFGRFGVSRSVEATNVVAEYDRAVELGVLDTRLQAAVFSTLSTPQVDVLGRSFNPVAEMTPRELAETIQQRYERIDALTEDAGFEATVAGESTPVTRFVADARLLETGTTIEVYLHVSAAVALGADLLVTVAVHPRLFGRRRETIETLLAGVTRG
jgi:hypothetical protein